MKKLFLMAMATLALFACNKEQSMDAPDVYGESRAVIKINVNGQAPSSRAVETGHPGNNGSKVFPKIVSVTVIPYNEYGAKITEIDLSPAQVKEAVYGDIAETAIMEDAINGVLVGLPVGTKKVDVVVNRPSGVNTTGITNVNYFNYRSEHADNGDNTAGTKDNFERVYLTTAHYGIGQELTGVEKDPSGVPLYEIGFSVSPSLARFEIFGGVNVAEAEKWIDGYGSEWKTMSKADFDAKYTALNLKMNAETGEYTYMQEVSIEGVKASTEVTFRNAVAGTAKNGFDKNLVYFPQYYWYAVGTGDPTQIDFTNIRTEAAINDDAAIGAGWVLNEDFATVGNTVTWYPNMFYAVDVESIFINNVKVRNATNEHYLHPWPGSFSATGWPQWYNSYHAGGWHTAGSSPENTFLCMGNMWDHIATTANPATDEETISYSAVTGGGVAEMSIIRKKAMPLTDKSVYYSASRNLGVATGKAAAYQIYEQSITATSDLDRVTTALPHVILKVKAYEDATKYAAGEWVTAKEFITIKAFQQGSTYVTNFRKSTIYRVDINDLLGAFVGKVPVPGGVHPNVPGTDEPIIPTDPIDPDPEMPGSQLKVKVNILPWTIQNIKPVV